MYTDHIIGILVNNKVEECKTGNQLNKDASHERAW